MLGVRLIICCWMAAIPYAAAQQPDWLADRVSERLASRASLEGSRIEVTSSSGVVTLTGTVAETQDKTRAVEIARRTRGVLEVRDRLTVQPRNPASADRMAGASGEDLAAAVARKLAQDVFPGAKAEKEWLHGWEVEGPNWEFTVEADDGDIILDGTVNSLGNIRKAIQTARTVSGVRSVESELRSTGYDPAWDIGKPPYLYYPW